MIRIIMLGRTGNNLFQYAFGRVLAERHGVPLVMDGAWFNEAGWRSVSCLKRLPIRAELRRDLTLAARLLLKTTGRHFQDFGNFSQVNECLTDHTFNPSHLDAPADCLVRGYFQSPLYFRGIEEQLRSELAMDDLPWLPATRDLARRVEKGKSVSVHVRRTDYVGNPDVAVCGEDYFKRAIRLLRDRHEGLEFHVFSDDPKWCSVHLAEDGVAIRALPEAEGDALHDLFLMSRASHHIICNSSYSWWAAWLGKNPGQQVILPERWFASGIIAPIQEKLAYGWEILDTSAQHE
jgi:hypothetical protein